MRHRHLLAAGVGVASLVCLLPAANHLAASPEKARVQGFVRDSTGAAVAGAAVELRSRDFKAMRTTDDTGRFEFGGVEGTGQVVVRAKGFAPAEREWTARPGATVGLEIVLSPAPVSEQLTVTAARTEMRSGDVGASVVVLGPSDLSASAPLTLDDTLRQVPGFTLLRRSGSRTANPTSQGVSLRGAGASGASRALVLADNIPLNDPFGGWVYWDRVPRESVSGIEVLRGAASSLYGTDALGGVVNVLRRRPTSSALSLEASWGNKRTPDLSFAAEGRLGRWGAQVAAEASRSDGYKIVDRADRGAVDTPVNASHTMTELDLERSVSDQARLFLRGSIFGEARHNGTPLQTNSTHLRQLALGGDWVSESLGSFSARLYGGPQLFDQNFSAVAAERNSETLTRSQRSPAHQLGGTVQWSRSAGSKQTLVAGIDTREVRGASDEWVWASGRIVSAVGAGGRERAAGLFGEDLIRLTSRWLVTVGARFDHWRDYAALQTTLPLAPVRPASLTAFPERTESAWSPRLSLLYKWSENLSLTASGYRAFRAPTLNELYRSFRVGNVMTLSNDALLAERLTGGEAGARASAWNRRLDLSGTFFWTELTRPVANVTLSVTPSLITRQRQNLGRTRSRGLELDAKVRLAPTVDLSAGYAFIDARVARFPANAAIEGLRIPLVPRHEFTFQARYANPARATVGVQGRLAGAEFDDDQNQLRLAGYFTLDALVSRPLGHGVEVFAAGENLTGQRYDVGRTPVRTIGPPWLGRVGIRVHLAHLGRDRPTGADGP